MNRKDQDTGSTALGLSLEMRETDPERRNNAETQTWKKQSGSIGDRTRLHADDFVIPPFALMCAAPAECSFWTEQSII